MSAFRLGYVEKIKLTVSFISYLVIKCDPKRPNNLDRLKTSSLEVDLTTKFEKTNRQLFLKS